MRNKMPQETKKERRERVIKECYARMVAIAKIELLFNQIEQLLPLSGSKTLQEDMLKKMARMM